MLKPRKKILFSPKYFIFSDIMFFPIDKIGLEANIRKKYFLDFHFLKFPKNEFRDNFFFGETEFVEENIFYPKKFVNSF